VLLATGVCMMFIAAPIEGFSAFNPTYRRVGSRSRSSRSSRWGAFWVFYGGVRRYRGEAGKGWWKARPYKS